LGFEKDRSWFKDESFGSHSSSSKTPEFGHGGQAWVRKQFFWNNENETVMILSLKFKISKKLQTSESHPTI
jgi:hypothetical protein